MICSEAERLFDAYLDGELSGALRLELDAHRLRCRRCQQTLAMLESFEHVLSTPHREPALSADFAERVMAGVQRTKPQRPRVRRWLLGSFAVANVAAAIALAVFWSSGPQPISTDPLSAALDQAFRERDKITLMDIIYDKRDQFLAARANVAGDLGSLARYVETSLSYPADVSRVTAFNPITGLFDIMLNQPVAEPQAPAAHDDQHSL